MPASEVAGELERALREAGTAERATQEKRYLKSDLEHFGVTVWGIRRVAREAVKSHAKLMRAELLELVRLLWAKRVHELRMAAIDILDGSTGLLGPEDIELLEELLRDSRTWAYVDSLAADVVGPLVERYPELGATLDRWAGDGDFWVRRAAMLALLLPLRRGDDASGEWERFARYADAMLDEREFFIRKAIGWVLREAGRRRPAEVAAWLAPRAARASGVTMREAVKYLPEADRERLMAAYREQRPAA